MAVPFQSDMVNEVLRNMHIARVGDATIRQTVALSEEIERRTGEKFIHLEMGSPGLPPSLAYCPFIFEKGSCTQTLIHKMKYEDKPQIGYRLAKYAAKELLRAESPLCNCDLIVPVPLHKKKLRKRGYNQSFWIAKGLHHVWKAEINTNCIERIYNNQTQTQKDVYERWKHKDLAFKVKEPETICGKSILIIDDVITTGTTIKACARAIAEAKPKEINFFALCHT